MFLIFFALINFLIFPVLFKFIVRWKNRSSKKIPKNYLLKRTRSPMIHHQGEHYDLKKLYGKLNEQYFEGKIDLKITWFGNRNSAPKTRIILGAYNQERGLIKIHRLLDQADVPDHYISFIIYHEILHHVVPPIKQRNRKRKIHHSEFLSREKQFQEYAAAKVFNERLKAKLFERNKTNFSSASCKGNHRLQKKAN